jgi:hypothetical protein
MADESNPLSVADMPRAQFNPGTLPSNSSSGKFCECRADASGLDKADDALEAALGKDRAIGPAMATMTNGEDHRDFLLHVKAYVDQVERSSHCRIKGRPLHSRGLPREPGLRSTLKIN